MTGAPDIPHGSSAVIDSSVLFAIGAPDNEKYQAFQQFVTQRELSVYIPTHVAEELGEAPDAYTFHRDRLRAAQEAGWLERAEIDYENPTVSEVIDRTRKRMVNLSADDVTEDEIEKTDTVLAGLAYQYASHPQAHVTVFVSDRIAEEAIRDVLSAMDIENRILVVEGREFVQNLLSEEL
jgi:hypothetical protein